MVYSIQPIPYEVNHYFVTHVVRPIALFNLVSRSRQTWKKISDPILHIEVHEGLVTHSSKLDAHFAFAGDTRADMSVMPCLAVTHGL